MHSSSVLLLALFAVIFALTVADSEEQRPAFAFIDRRGNEGKFAYNSRFAKRSVGEENNDSKFAFAFAKRSVAQDDVVEQVVEKFARRFAREVMQGANERGFAFA